MSRGFIHLTGWVTLSDIQDWDVAEDSAEQRRLRRQVYWDEVYKSNKEEALLHGEKLSPAESRERRAEKRRLAERPNECKNSHAYVEGSYFISSAGSRICYQCQELNTMRRREKAPPPSPNRSHRKRIIVATE